MTIRKQLEQVLSGLHPSEQLHELEKLSMKLRKINGLRIGEEVRNAHDRFKQQKRQYEQSKTNSNGHSS